MSTVKSRDLGERAGANLGMVLVSVTIPADGITEDEGTYLFQADQPYRLVAARLAFDAAASAGDLTLYKTTSDPDATTTAMTSAIAVDTTLYAQSNSLTLSTTDANLELATGDQIVAHIPATYTVGAAISHYNFCLLLLPLGDTFYWKSN